MNPQEQLLNQLSPVIGLSASESLVRDLAGPSQHAQQGSNRVAAALALLGELQDVSGKVASAAIQALPDLQRRAGLDDVAAWLDLGIGITTVSGAAGLKYFSESPLILSLIGDPARQTVLGVALELADNERGDTNTALEFFRQAPALLEQIPSEQLARWAQMGAELAQYDYVLGIEFFRQAPAIARVLAADDVRGWIAFGMKLVTRNSLGKTDYLGTLEFFRSCPGLLGEIDDPSIRLAVIRLGSTIADRSAETALRLLAEAPALLRRVPQSWQSVIVEYGLLVADRDAEAALQYVRRCPEILELLPEDPERRAGFENWFKVGMEVLEFSAEGGRSYFALQTTKALASVEEAMAGVPLRQVARSLTLFVEAMTGSPVIIQAAPQQDGEGRERPRVSADGRTITLPSVLRRHPTREQNIRLYTIMTAHEAGHLEYGTYRVNFDRLVDLSDAVRARYRDEQTAGVHPSALGTLAELFELYPQPRLIQDLWTVLEDARVEFRLKQEYPGLRDDLARFAREAVTTRSFAHGMSVREMVVDALLLLSTGEPATVQIPEAIRDLVEPAWDLSQTILTPTATPEDVLRVADRLYVLLDERLSGSPLSQSSEVSDETEQGAGPQASEQLSSRYRPVTNWAYRGEMNPVSIRREPVTSEDGQTPPPNESPADPQPASGRGERSGGRGAGRESQSHGQDLASGSQPSPIVTHLLSVTADPVLATSAEPQARGAYIYDEWDGALKDYRVGWCRVLERLAREGGSDLISAVRMKHGAAMKLLRRYFETIRPSALRRLAGQSDGEEIDLDAAVRHRIDRRAGADPSDRLYVHRHRRDRSVAAAFLVDLSGSTSRKISGDGPGTPPRIIDVEKEGLVLLSDALEAIGDPYAIYGYSGQGREAVDFLVLKDFDEPASPGVGERLGGLEPLQQNRDGAAIRHATRRLRDREAKVRLLILLSDGKPLDDRYADEYSLEDTKMALREARMQGIEPFCITVDRQADDYLRRMYGEVGFVVIDQAEELPQRLPRIYQRLTT